jgi:hypothetical protein
VAEGPAGIAELAQLFLFLGGGGAGGAKPLLHRASFLVFKKIGCGPSMNTEPLGYVAIFMAQATSGVAISNHRPLFTQARQGLEKKMTSEEHDNLLLWGLQTWA